MANLSYAKPGINTAPGAVALTSPYSAQFPGSSPYTRLMEGDFWDKWQAQRTVYRVTAADLGSPFTSGIWGVNWDDQFPDANYSVIATCEDPNFSQSSPAMSPPQILIVSKTAAGVKGRFSFAPFGFGVNRDLTVHILGVHD